MAKQRITKNLGLNHALDNPSKYRYIEEKLQITHKHCSRGNAGVPHHRYGFMHEGPNPLPIREFNFQSSSKDLLQPNCRSCEKKFRRGRLDRYRKIYGEMTKEEICSHYREKYGEYKTCNHSHCSTGKQPPENFPKSIGMETGLHNMCKTCSGSYSESVGSRWAIYSPDGHEVIHLSEKDKCSICGKTDKKIKLHKDHIWPISKGGTDYKENIQWLCSFHNLSKSNSIIGFKSIQEISFKMICKRYHNILKTCINNKYGIQKFEITIVNAVRNFIIEKTKKTDRELKDFFADERRRNNRKHDPERCVRKFREYSNKAIIDVEGYLKDRNQII